MGVPLVSFDRALNWIAFGQLSGPVDESTQDLLEIIDGGGFAVLGFDENGDYEAGDTEGRFGLAMELLLGAIETGKVSLFGDPQYRKDLGLDRKWEKLSADFVRRADFDEDSIDRVMYDGKQEYGHLFVRFDELRNLLSFLRPEQDGARVRVGDDDERSSPPAGSNVVSLSTIADETRCAELIANLGRDHVGSPLTKKAVWETCSQQIPRLSFRAFGRCWATRAPVEWRQPGRRPSARSRSDLETPR